MFVATTAMAGKDGSRQPPTPQRSLPPEEFDRQTEEVFQGTAQDRTPGPRPSLQPRAESQQPATTADAEKLNSAFDWSRLISADTLADEIKSHRTELTQDVRNVRTFRAGANRDARMRLSVIAVMFGLTAEYDGPVRWQKQAAGARDAFASSGRNSKAADDNTFKEARRRSEDLDELIRGGSVEFPKSGDTPRWDEIAERPPLMQRLEISLDKRLRPWTANAREFQRHQREAVHEAEVVAALAEIIQHEEYEFYDDDEYLAFCKRLRDHAIAARTAARENNFDSLQQAVGEISKSCSACHEDYR